VCSMSPSRVKRRKKGMVSNLLIYMVVDWSQLIRITAKHLSSVVTLLLWLFSGTGILCPT
jgi:hypothetical protein